jgi:F-type H+-transporting ATPase subunit epsilon
VPFSLRVVSVERSLYEGEVDEIQCVGGDGELGILPNHAPLLTTLKPGTLSIMTAGKEELLFVGGGFLEVLPDRVTVLADVAERGHEIDAARAEAARQRALEHLQGTVSPEEQVSLRDGLAKAEARLHLARLLRAR